MPRGRYICSAANNGKPDLLPDEPGGYDNFNGLFGARYVNPVINPSGPMTDLDGNVIQDANGHIGFPGFDGMSASVSLSWVAQMQEAGVPVTYAYISDAHDGHGTSGNIHFAYSPGEAGYVQQLQDYDRAFQKFFDQGYARPLAMKRSSFIPLAQMYKQLNAPFGQFAMATLKASTLALASNDPGDATYTSIEGQIQSLTAQRDALASQMIDLLNGAEFQGQSFSDAQAKSLLAQGQNLLDQASNLPH